MKTYRQIEQLDVGTFIFDDAGNARQRRELVVGRFTLGFCQRRQERGLNGGQSACEFVMKLN